MISFKNVIENIIYIIVMGVMLLINTFFVLKSQESIITTAIEKSTTTIENTIKNKKGTLDFNQSNTLNPDSVVDKVNKHRGWNIFRGGEN